MSNFQDTTMAWLWLCIISAIVSSLFLSLDITFAFLFCVGVIWVIGFGTLLISYFSKKKKINTDSPLKTETVEAGKK